MRASAARNSLPLPRAPLILSSQASTRSRAKKGGDDDHNCVEGTASSASKPPSAPPRGLLAAGSPLGSRAKESNIPDNAARNLGKHRVGRSDESQCRRGPARPPEELLETLPRGTNATA